MTPKRMNTILKGVLVVLILLIAGGLYGANIYLTNLAHKTADIKAQVEVGQKQLEIYTQTKNVVTELDYVDGLAAQVLPETEDQAATIAEIAQFARRSNLGVVRIEFVTDQDQKSTDKAKKSALPQGVRATPIVVELEKGAHYQDVLGFLVLLEENRRKMQVSDISLTPSATDGSQLDEVTISINLYTQAPKTQEKAP